MKLFFLDFSFAGKRNEKQSGKSKVLKYVFTEFINLLENICTCIVFHREIFLVSNELTVMLLAIDIFQLSKMGKTRKRDVFFLYMFFPVW